MIPTVNQHYWMKVNLKINSKLQTRIELASFYYCRIMKSALRNAIRRNVFPKPILHFSLLLGAIFVFVV